MTPKKDAVLAAVTLAEDIDRGQVDPAALDAELVERCRELCATVLGPDDPLFDLQTDIARQVLAAGGLSVDELAEWLAVARRRAGVPPEPLGGPDLPADAESSVSEPHSPENGDNESEPQP